MKYTLLLCVIILARTTQAQVLENVKTAPLGDKVIITYDLSSPDPNQKFKITAFSGHDSYVKALQHVTGAVGENVTPGRGLRIEWDARNSLPADFNGTIAVRLKGVAMPQLKPLDQSVYKKGSVVNIAWTGGGKADKMNVELIRDEKVYKVLGTQVENNNALSWKIPNNIKAGSNYSIRLTDVTDPMQPAVSSNFQIKPKIPLLVKLAVPVVVIAAIIIIPPMLKDNPPGPEVNNNLPAITVKPD